MGSIQAFIPWGLFMVSFNANSSPLPLPYCSGICLVLPCAVLKFHFGSLPMYWESNLFNLVNVWLVQLNVLKIVQLCPVIDKFTIISKISSGSDSSLTSSATFFLVLHVALVVVVVVFLLLVVHCFLEFVMFCSLLESTTSSSIPFS